MFSPYQKNKNYTRQNLPEGIALKTLDLVGVLVLVIGGKQSQLLVLGLSLKFDNILNRYVKLTPPPAMDRVKIGVI